MLLDDFAHKCVMLEKTRVFGDEGGWTTQWSEGAEFDNYAALDTSMEARRAEKEGVTSVYNVLVKQSVPLEYNDYFRDTETGRTYRVTSNPVDKQTPKMSAMNLKFFTAEAKEVPQ